MPLTQFTAVVRHIHELATCDGAEASDAQLLQRFLERRDETAFGALVRRHSRMVLGVCQHVLRQREDAEDAFQATFLVLARSAASIRKGAALPSWLYGVAYRLASNARRDLMKRQAQERKARKVAHTEPDLDLAFRELQAVLAEEVKRLPDKYRAPFVLCCLEGKSKGEAAVQLGWKEGTVSGRLAEARKRMQQRLARRGLALSAVLCAGALAVGEAPAVSPTLIKSTIQAALGAAAGRISGPAAALAEGAMHSMLASKVKVVTSLVLLFGLLAVGAGMQIFQAWAAPPTAETASAATAAEKAEEPPAAKPPADPAEQVEASGQVLAPDGKPIAGAELFLVGVPWKETDKTRPVLRAKSDADGRFHFTVVRSELADGTSLVALAKDQGANWLKANDLAKGAVMLKLVPDVPIAGRVVDLEGRPVAGVAVRVDRIQTTPAEDLTPALKSWQRDHQGAMNELSKSLYQPDRGGIFGSVRTDAAGRFHITGVGRERMAVLKLTGDTIQHKTLYVFTRPKDDVVSLTKSDAEQKMPGMPRGTSPTVYGPTFDHAALPSKPIVGVVRDQRTGKPIPNVGINGMTAHHHWEDYATTETDAEGRFKLVGVAKGPDYSISAYARGGKTYLPGMKKVADSEGLKPLTVDFELVRGVLVKGRITDKTTGKPVDSALWYNPLADNKYFRDLPGNEWYCSVSQGHRTEKDGSFSLLALPGSGVILVRAEGEAGGLYTEAFIAPEDKAKAYRQEEEGVGGSFLSAGGSIEFLHGHHAYKLLDLAQDAETFECHIELDRGLTQTGTIVDPEGKPVTGASIAGLRAWGGVDSLKAGEFTARGLNPARSRSIAVMHKERKLVGHVTLRGDEKEPVVVKLGPWGSVSGRVLDEEGNPLTDAELMVHYQDNSLRWLFESGREKLKTDREGRFRVEGLFPGLPFGISLVKKGTIYDPGEDYRKLTTKQGETKDLGDVKAKVYRIE